MVSLELICYPALSMVFPELIGQRRSGRGAQRREGGLGTQQDALLEEADLRLEPDADAEL